MLAVLGEVLPPWSATPGGLMATAELWGPTGTEIAAATSSGFSGAGVMSNDLLDSSSRYRVVIEGWGTFPPGSLYVDEYGRLVATSSGQTTYQLYENNVLVPGIPASRTISVTIGGSTGRIVPTVVVDKWTDIIVVPPGI